MENPILNIIRDWVEVNRKLFWKYEVSSYYKAYKICITNMPRPSTDDIKLQSHHHLLNSNQKSQLCNAIKKAYSETISLKKSSINIKFEYVDGIVTTTVA